MSIISDSIEIREVSGISEEEKQKIIDFLQGAVYCWCKNRPNEWFALRDLVGGENYYWEGTALEVLFEKHKNKSNDPVKEAGKDAGWLLKKVLKKDLREFESTKKGLVRHYKWIK